MKHPIYRVTSFSITGTYVISVSFNDGTTQSIDFAPVLKGPVFDALRNRALFSRVRIDPETGTLVWPNGADFDPAVLHDWPDIKDRYASLAQSWDTSLTDCAQNSPPYGDDPKTSG